MHVVSKAALRRFWAIHPRAKGALTEWYKAACRADWKSFVDVRATHPAADWVNPLVVFDIGGNKYRLIAAIHFNRRKVFVRNVLTHAEYVRGDWKTE
ncbi:MAG: type II toxin-antitoxin system HigB family toxin [Gemmataceae bacterium]